MDLKVGGINIKCHQQSKLSHSDFFSRQIIGDERSINSDRRQKRNVWLYSVGGFPLLHQSWYNSIMLLFFLPQPTITYAFEDIHVMVLMIDLFSIV